MKQEIKELFKKAYRKLFRKTNRRTVFTVGDSSMEGTLGVAPDAFQRMFAKAYPDAAKFIELIKVLPNTKDAFLLPGSLVATGFIAATGLSTSYREWERKCLEDTKRQYPDLKILVFHADPEGE